MCDESSLKRPTMVVSFASLDSDKLREEILIEEMRQPANNESVYELIKEALLAIWETEEEIKAHKDQVLVFVTDGASYMKVAAANLRQRLDLTELVHVTCTTHGVALVAEAIRKAHPNANRFCSLMKLTQANSVGRKDLFRECPNDHVTFETLMGMPPEDVFYTSDNTTAAFEALSDPAHPKWNDLLLESKAADIWTYVWDGMVSGENENEPEESRPLPPHPVNTRFGTFLVACNFYHHYWLRVINYVNRLEPKSASSKEAQKALKELKAIFKDDEARNKLKREIDFLHEHFKRLPLYIARLENENLEVIQAQGVLARCREYLASQVGSDQVFAPNGKVGSIQVALTKLDLVLVKNEGLKVLCELAAEDKIYDYSPTASIRIERVFSALKLEVGNRRHFGEDNFKRHMESSMHLKNKSPNYEKRVRTFF